MSNLILSADEYLAQPRSPETWLIEPLLPTGGTMLLYGDPKVGKSYAAIQLALALSGACLDWFGFPVRNPGPVVYVQLDTPRSLWAERLDTLKAAGLPVERLFLADRETLKTWPFNILNDDHFVLLQAALLDINPLAVIIDTLRESHSGDENDSTAMQIVTSRLVAATHPAALVVVSHSRKPSENGYDLINDNRGSSYATGAMDAICRFSKKGMHYVGRAIEEGSLKLSRNDDGTWGVSDVDITPHIQAVLADPSLSSVKARAAQLALKTGKTEEACRSILRRRVGQ